MNHFKIGDHVTAKANEVHGAVSGTVSGIIRGDDVYTDWMYLIDVPGKQSIYWYENQIDRSAISPDSPQ